MPKPRVAAAALALAGAAALAVTAPTQAAPAHTITSAAGLPVVYAPYFQTYYSGSPAAEASAAGVKYLSLGFILATGTNTCSVAWNGDPSTPIAYSHYGAAITTLQHAGGDAIPSFGGSAPKDRDIAAACASPAGIAAAYEKVITTYQVKRIDLDVEGDAQSDNAATDRRNKAVHLVETWAAAHNRTVEFTYTLPADATGMNQYGIGILKNAVADKATIRAVNLMTFDYCDNQPHHMAIDSEAGAQNAVSQLRGIYPSKTTARLWAMIELSNMLGVDDCGPGETLTLNDATQLTAWANAHSLAGLSTWALGRDNSTCAGDGVSSDTCSGLRQPTYAFAHIMNKLHA